MSAADRPVGITAALEAAATAETLLSRRKTDPRPELTASLRLLDIEGSIVAVKRDLLLNSELIVEVQKQVHERFDAISAKQDELLDLLRARTNGNGHG